MIPEISTNERSLGSSLLRASFCSSGNANCHVWVMGSQTGYQLCRIKTTSCTNIFICRLQLTSG